MLKTVAATALSLTLALGALAPTPAHAANQEDIAKILLGVGFAALIAKALHEQAEDRDKKATKEVHVHRHITNRPVTKVIEKPAPRSRVVVQQPPKRVVVKEPTQSSRPGSGWGKNASSVIPSTCQRTFRHDGENRVYVTRRCLEREGVRTANLPNQCERVLDLPGNASDRLVWNRGCLEKNGYRIR
ncbi:hypothetical protein [Tropicimonas marinistellae]|uniref:hypothetical protein n=1 Tax=Tropicimonas marinistellae TaxID=1739787 RepID=UPI0008359CDE|nr:hypothetical protein [Tropicimonas marinistellae]